MANGLANIRTARTLVPITLDTVYPAFNGFHCSVGGTISFIDGEGTTVTSVEVVAGTYYPYDIVTLRTTGTDGSVVLHGCR